MTQVLIAMYISTGKKRPEYSPIENKWTRTKSIDVYQRLVLNFQFSNPLDDPVIWIKVSIIIDVLCQTCDGLSTAHIIRF